VLKREKKDTGKIRNMKQKEDTVDRYQVLCEEWRQIFLKMDLETVAAKLPGLKLTEEALKFNYFGEPHRIDRKTGFIWNEAAKERLTDFGNLMIVYHLLYYSEEHPVLSGEWVPFREVKMAGVFDAAYQKMAVKPFAQTFAEKTELLKQVASRLGFPDEKYGDVSFRVPVFDCLPLIFIFWDGDDEYPAQANILFDRNITAFTHAETVVLIAEMASARLIRAAGEDWDFIQEI
ncbi:MAG: DUF3786 domain-containing protein, partial [Lachnospiraceae bacterium]|nr:DUF3786 domain-containing protein [Lachnospiraceae bacterium]